MYCAVEVVWWLTGSDIRVTALCVMRGNPNACHPHVTHLVYMNFDLCTCLPHMLSQPPPEDDVAMEDWVREALLLTHVRALGLLSRVNAALTAPAAASKDAPSGALEGLSDEVKQLQATGDALALVRHAVCSRVQRAACACCLFTRAACVCVRECLLRYMCMRSCWWVFDFVCERSCWCVCCV